MMPRLECPDVQLDISRASEHVPPLPPSSSSHAGNKSNLSGSQCSISKISSCMFLISISTVVIVMLNRLKRRSRRCRGDGRPYCFPPFQPFVYLSELSCAATPDFAADCTVRLAVVPSTSIPALDRYKPPSAKLTPPQDQTAAQSSNTPRHPLPPHKPRLATDALALLPKLASLASHHADEWLRDVHLFAPSLKTEGPHLCALKVRTAIYGEKQSA